MAEGSFWIKPQGLKPISKCRHIDAFPEGVKACFGSMPRVKKKTILGQSRGAKDPSCLYPGRGGGPLIFMLEC